MGGANSSQLCVSLRGRKDRSVTLAKINLAAVPSTLIITRRLRLESKPHMAPDEVTLFWSETLAGSRRSTGIRHVWNRLCGSQRIPPSSGELATGGGGNEEARLCRLAKTTNQICGAHIHTGSASAVFSTQCVWHSHWLPHSLTLSFGPSAPSPLLILWREVRRGGGRKRGWSQKFLAHVILT